MLWQKWVEVESLCSSSGPLTVCKYLAVERSLTGTFTYLGLLCSEFQFSWVSIVNVHNSFKDVSACVLFAFFTSITSSSHTLHAYCGKNESMQNI